MSAPQIPNLNTFRKGNDRGPLRGRGDHNVSSGHEDDSLTKDEVVQQTDNDASGSRLSAVELGYLHDPFARAITRNGGPRRFPLINRGTYVRTTAIDDLVSRFLELESESSKKKQIISLGAGSDTRLFRLLFEYPTLDVVYHELDFAANTRAKIKTIRTSSLLRKTLRLSGPEDMTISPEGDALHSRLLHIHPMDLRTLSASAANEIELPGLDTELPTLLISECCLVYLSPTEAVNVLDFFTKGLFPPSPPTSTTSTTPLGLLIYEPIRPDDPFGKTMVSNLAVRGIHLQTLHRYASLEAQRERFKEQGFLDGQGAADINFIWENWISDAEKERVARLEMLDELEEWRLLAAHYCVAWGWREGQINNKEEDEEDIEMGFEGWKLIASQ